jgi:hypothetical protein
MAEIHIDSEDQLIESIFSRRGIGKCRGKYGFQGVDEIAN